MDANINVEGWGPTKLSSLRITEEQLNFGAFITSQDVNSRNYYVITTLVLNYLNW